MTTIVFVRKGRESFLYESNSGNHSEGTLMHYLTSEGTTWTYLIDPSIKNDTYSPGNYYFTRRDNLYLYIAEEHYLDDDDPDQEFKPAVVLLNSMLGILIAFEHMYANKVLNFTLSLEGKRYTFTDPDSKTIVVDPDLGNLYNDTIPRIIARRINGAFEYEIFSGNNSAAENIRLFIKLLEENNAQDFFITMHSWPSRMANWQEREKKVRYGSLIIENGGDVVEIKRKTKEVEHQGWLIITKESLKKFLQAWDTRLQHCDAFTIIFLGRTVRFFEGEPMAADYMRQTPE